MVGVAALVIGVAFMVTSYPLLLFERVVRYASKVCSPLFSITNSVKSPELVYAREVLSVIFAEETFISPISPTVVVTSKESATAKMLAEAMSRIKRVAIIVFFMLCSLRRVAPVQDLNSVPFPKHTRIIRFKKTYVNTYIKKKIKR